MRAVGTTRRAVLAGLGVTGTAIGSVGLRAAEHKGEYRVSSMVGAPYPQGLAAERWCQLVRERTEGRINMVVYPGSQLVGGDATREAAALAEGSLDMAVGSAVRWAPHVPEFSLFALPFLIPDEAALDAVLAGEPGRRLLEAATRKGLVPLAWGDGGQREISNAKRDIRRPADLRDLRIAVPKTPILAEALSALGAIPVPLDWTETLTALAAGTVDGQENPLSDFATARLSARRQTHLTLWGGAASPLVFAVSRPLWDGFAPADQATLRTAAVEAAAFGRVLVRNPGSRGEPSPLDVVRGAGVTITRLKPDERRAFERATRPVYDRWAAQVGPDLVNQAERLVATSRSPK